MARRAVPRQSRTSIDAASSPMRLPASIDRRDVPAIVERCRPIVDCGDPPAPPCDARDISDPCLPTIEVLAVLALAARRQQRELRLEHASPALLQLLGLCGLDEVVRVTDPDHPANLTAAPPAPRLRPDPI